MHPRNAPAEVPQQALGEEAASAVLGPNGHNPAGQHLWASALHPQARIGQHADVLPAGSACGRYALWVLAGSACGQYACGCLQAQLVHFTEVAGCMFFTAAVPQAAGDSWRPLPAALVLWQRLTAHLMTCWGLRTKVWPRMSVGMRLTNWSGTAILQSSAPDSSQRPAWRQS